MLRKSSFLLTMCCLLAIVMYSSLRMNAEAQQPPAPGVTEKTAPAVPPEVGTDPFAVPAGTDERALQLFLMRITQIPPPVGDGKEELEHFNKIDKAVKEVLGREVSEELFANVAQLRFQLLSILEELGDKTASARMEAYLKELSESKRPSAKALVARSQMQTRLLAFEKSDAAAQQAFIDEITKMLQNTSKDDDEQMQLAIDVAMDIGTLLERSGSAQTIPTYKKFIAALKARQDERMTRLIAEVSRILNRLELPGKEADIKGNTLTNKAFDVKEYRGKVVLVDFWATWCKACVMELPELQELYTFYHDKGLEIVGVSVDSEKDVLESFVKERRIPWVTLFEEEKLDGSPNSIADKFGVNMFPTMMLLDKEGKVVTVQIGGLHGTSNNTTIAKEIEKLLGPMPKSDDAGLQQLKIGPGTTK